MGEEVDVVEEPLEEEMEPFMVEDESEDDKVCLTCSKLRIGTRVCGIYKPFNDFSKRKGYGSIDETFTCSEYTPES